MRSAGILRSQVTLRSQWLYAVGVAMVLPSLLVGLDLGLSFQCARVPLSGYLGAGAIGAVVGPFLGRKLHGDGPLRRPLRALVGVAVGLGLLGAAGMTSGFLPPRWDSHCAWRYCGRALGPGLGRSPFPVGTPSCGSLHMCANEYPYSDDEYRRLLDLTRERGCTPP